MRTKVTLVLIFLNVALFFFIFKFERNWRTEAAALETRRRVFGPEAADIRSLRVTNHTPNGVSYTLERQRDTWSLTQPLNWPANPHAASSIINELQLLEHRATFTVAEAAKNQQPLADFGLEKPKLTVEFTSGDPAAAGSTPRPSTKILIGDHTPDEKRLYILSADGQRVHVVDRSLADRLSLPIEQLRADTLLTIRVFEARSLSIHTAGDSSRNIPGIRVQILRDGQRWNFAAPHTARASKTAIELAINGLNALQARTFDPKPAPATLPASAPALRVTLEGTNRQETLYLGEPVPNAQPVTVNGQPSREFYAQLEGRTALFTVAVSATLLDTLRSAQETLREKRFLDFDPALVTTITIAAPVQPTQPPITLQRLETTAGQPRESEQAWQVVHRAEGAQTPQTLPADVPAIRHLLQRLNLLSAESPAPGASPFKSDAPTISDLEEWGFNRPAREVTLAFSGGTPPIVLRIGTDASRNVYYARVGTPTEPGVAIYVIRPEIVDELPLDPAAWRSRTVGEPLAAVARIAALKLTDLTENKVLAEHTFTPAGETMPAPRDPKAVATVVAALRHLRAKQFVPGGFAEKVLAAGEDRPWRFQLEATVALPGGTGQELTRPLTLLLTERIGAAQQFAGSKELDVVFTLEQPLIDALWSLAYGGRDPGPPAAPKK